MVKDGSGNNSKDEKVFSRRDFLKTTGVAAGGIAGGALLGGLTGFQFGSDQQSETAETDTGGETAGGEGGGGTYVLQQTGRFRSTRSSDGKNLSGR